ncbi:MAG: hypothetical protein HS113_29375 [Verrucomicrobiales bacterium]|nr:hypothetical protein [Verrucomicrobiales bacterium]
MQRADQAATRNDPLPGTERAPGITWDGGLAFRSVTGDLTPRDELLRLIAERIRVAAGHLGLTRKDLERIFVRHSVFEGETPGGPGRAGGFLLVETHHLIQGRVGKGALKLVFPEDLLGKGEHFQEAAPGVIEVHPPPGTVRWACAAEAEERVKQAMRELMTGESLSMSLKSQATGAPFGGSEGLVLCAAREFDEASGRYQLKPVLRGGEEPWREDKEVIERILNDAGALLTRVGRIAYDRIVHAAETNSTLTSRLGLQLPSNVLEGHLRSLLDADPAIIIGDEDMTARLRELRGRRDYAPTACVLARAAAKMQMEHALLLPGSREQLRRVLETLPPEGSPPPAQYEALMDLFFGRGEVQRQEDRLYHHREPILRALSVALSTRCLDECGEPRVLELYLRTLLDNQWILLERALARLLPPGQALPVGWFAPDLLLAWPEQQTLAALMPGTGLGREGVQEAFWGIVNVLCEARDRAMDALPALIRRARIEVLGRAIRAITSTGEVVPTVDRLQFFTLPLSYECATPKLGVVTRKPVEVCGSELRPEAMAQGAVMALEIHLKQSTGRPRPLAGLTVAIEGLGNAGKNVAHLMVQQGATIVAVSDSRGAVVRPGGFTRQELAAVIAHKNAGRRFDTFLSSPMARMLAPESRAGLAYDPEPERLKQAEADVLVLTAIPASIRGEHARTLGVRVICELTGAAVSGEAKRVLKERGIAVIPDNLGSSGGLLVSLSEMLQNSTGQVWDRAIETENLYAQLTQSYAHTAAVARTHDVDLATASDMVALRRMHELARYREQLEALAWQLAERLRAVQVSERVLVLSDNDEDGVASAAILHGLIAHLNPGAEDRVTHLNESFRSPVVPELVRQAEAAGHPIRHVFALDRAYPASEPGRSHLAEVVARCRVTFVNNHPLPEAVRGTDGGPPAALGEVLYISPQTLSAPVPAEDFPTALVLREVATVLVEDERLLEQIGWQAAVGCCLDVPGKDRSEWLLFYSRYHPDRTVEAARAIRLVTRVRGYRTAVQALVSVERPDQLETHEAWEQFLAAYRTLHERVQVLVGKIEWENRGRPYAAHFFTEDEVASPTPVAGDERNELDFYHWISEPLTERGDLVNRPILVAQMVTDPLHRRCLGVRIRSPRGVDLRAAGLPAAFQSGGLPNTAIARIPVADGAVPRQVFLQLVEEVWWRAAGLQAPPPPAEADLSVVASS